MQQSSSILLQGVNILECIILELFFVSEIASHWGPVQSSWGGGDNMRHPVHTHREASAAILASFFYPERKQFVILFQP